MSYITNTRPLVLNALTGIQLQETYDGSWVNEFPQVSISVPSHRPEVYSWRGKRPSRDNFGWLPPNAFVLKRNQAVYPEGFLLDVQYLPNAHHVMSGLYWVYSGAGSAASVWSSDDYIDTSEHGGFLQQAITEAYEKLNDPQIPGFTWIFESKETVKWLISLCSQFQRLLWKFRGYTKFWNVHDIAKLDSEAASRWLEFRYAVMPLILQIKEALDLLAARQKELQVYTGYVSRSNVISGSDHIWSPLGHDISWHKEVSLKVTGACKLYPSFKLDPHPYGLGPYDVLLGAWEIVRLSFVIDWFLDIGAYLASYRPGGASVAYQTNTLVVEEKTTLTRWRIKHAYGDFSLRAFNPVEPAGKRLFIARSIGEDKPLFPAFNHANLGLLRTLDAASLLFLSIRNMVRK